MRRKSIVDKIGDLDPDRDPRLDPRPGDRVRFGPAEPYRVAEVLEAPTPHEDPKLGPEPGVLSRVDDVRYGGRHTSMMSLESWRIASAGGSVIERGTP
jgi:hypothetical protein